MRDPGTPDSRTALPVTGVSTGPAITHSTRPSHPTTLPGTTTGTTSLSTGCPVDPSVSAPGRGPGAGRTLPAGGLRTARRGRPAGDAGCPARAP
ncbi:hypothetical protein, partial [Streptomyces sp. NPDC057557]|uniref:hypothetical protein n=1 Tax=Streptomyces sp. NPDC057557 TaxID=3346167 RepID=UPI003690EF66